MTPYLLKKHPVLRFHKHPTHYKRDDFFYDLVKHQGFILLEDLMFPRIPSGPPFICGTKARRNGIWREFLFGWNYRVGQALIE